MRLPVRLAVLVLGYLATGIYLVRANEQALVERMGRLARVGVPSGLHVDLPWPWSRVRRVNVHEVRTLSLGSGDPGALPIDRALRDAAGVAPGEFLTADKNILHLQAELQYRIEQPRAWLYDHASPEAELALSAEMLLAQAVAQSGVDYVHPLGLNQLSQRVARELGPLAAGLGASIESFAISGVFPPVEVKAAFLEVSNARADKDRLLELERSRAEQRISAALATALEIRDRAESFKHSAVETARGAADRFHRVVDRMAQEAQTTGQPIPAVRQRVMQRRFLEDLEEILPRLRDRVLLDANGPIDLTILPGEAQPLPPETPPANRAPGRGRDGP